MVLAVSVIVLIGMALWLQPWRMSWGMELPVGMYCCGNTCYYEGPLEDGEWGYRVFEFGNKP
jgi:hypothetical protein